MRTKEIELISEMLADYSDRLSNDGFDVLPALKDKKQPQVFRLR